jgi:SAM-dependent methyltransferase
MITALVTSLVLVVVLACIIYPGEFSYVSPRLNRWFYDRSASNYHQKWRAAAYRDPAIQKRILQFARQSVQDSGTCSVLDLGCGTGRGIRLVSPVLPAATLYTGIDYSGSMLQGFREWIDSQGHFLSERIELIQEDLAHWADRDQGQRSYGLILLLEAGEFVPNFSEVLRRVSAVLAPNGGLLMTRPANLWFWFFPGRLQSRRLLTRLLISLGFAEPEYVRWRARYELVFCKRL